MKIVCMLTLVLLLTISVLPAVAAGIPATLNDKISTRSGPSVEYESTGTFFEDGWQNEQVTVLSKARGDDAWWLLVEFSDDGESYRLYTGARRVNVDLETVPEEQILGTGEMTAAGDVPGHYGPDSTYAMSENDVPWCVEVTVWNAENSYLLVDFFDENIEKQRRAWVYTELADINWADGLPEGARAVNKAELKPGDMFADDEQNSCTILNYGPVGGNTVLSLTLHGKTVYESLNVKMEGSDHGAFATAEGDGEIWFEEDQVFIDAYLPDFDSIDTLLLYKTE